MHIPSATYRIQFSPQFTFDDGRKIIGYLKDLGITDIYASPVFKARKGSLHGYDVVDPNTFNPELGGEKPWRFLMGGLAANRMGWIQDIVPNHMAYDYANTMLMDVMEWGPKSAFYDFFDIDWHHAYESLRGKLLAPFLGKYYGECLEGEEIRLDFDDGEITVRYHGIKFPLRMESYFTVLKENIEGKNREPFSAPAKLGECLLPLQRLFESQIPMLMEKLKDEGVRVKKCMGELAKKDSSVAAYIQGRMPLFNGGKGNPEGFNRLDRLLSEQHFRLSFWKVATEEVNYRRFFNLNELICLRTEEDKVFDHINGLVFRMMEEAGFSGLRIDHIDGLYDPASYLNKLRAKNRDMFLVAEKILALDEDIPDNWPVQGTTGYDALNRINGIFCKRENEKKIDRIYTRFTGETTSFPELVSQKKRMIIGKHMAGDVDNLAHAVKRIAGRYRSGRDITLYGLRRAIVEIMTHFPVYRTYRSLRFFREKDKEVIGRAVDDAGKRIPEFHFELEFIRRLLLEDPEDSLPQEDKSCWLEFVMRLQQFTGPLMAKGFEDTVLYIFNRLLSLNEVGGDPGTFGLRIEDFHSFNRKRSQRRPHAMTATATHDTKRGEDVRARLNVLSEIPDEWSKRIRSWRRMNRNIKKKVKGIPVPEKDDEYFLYQSLVGAFPFEKTEWPSFKERMKAYTVKAVREAKIHTAWLKPDTEYEQAFQDFVDSILTPSSRNAFFRDLQEFQKEISYFGVFNSLSQVLLKMTVPGVPDFYQGTELWDLSLVDPDNRRPVDYKKRGALLNRVIERTKKDILELIAEIISGPGDGRPKLFLIHRILQLRRRHADVFRRGEYIPLETGGKHKSHIAAFMKIFDGTRAVSIVPRFLTSLIAGGELPLGQKVWGDTSVLISEEFAGRWENAVTGRAVISTGAALPAAEVFAHFPAAVLIQKEES